MTTLRTTWETYGSAWKAGTREEKRAALLASVARDCTYRDPVSELRGHDALVDYMLAFHQQIPGGHFVITYFCTHHDRSVAKWNMVDASGKALGDGVSYGEYGADGKLVAMTGFFDVPPEA
jgi:hypothetical protein